MSILNKVTKNKKEEAEIVTEKADKELRRNKLSKDKIGSIVNEPIVTEKSSNIMPLNKYVFKVANNATKSEVRKAIEGLYNVNVVSVNILKTASKSRRVGRSISSMPGFKKAVVTIKAGESIELIKS